MVGFDGTVTAVEREPWCSSLLRPGKWETPDPFGVGRSCGLTEHRPWRPCCFLLAILRRYLAGAFHRRPWPAMGHYKQEALTLSKFLAWPKALELFGSHQYPSIAWQAACPAAQSRGNAGCQLPWVWLPCLQARAGDSLHYQEAVQGWGWGWGWGWAGVGKTERKSIGPSSALGHTPQAPGNSAAPTAFPWAAAPPPKH
jgi:hypothetical protein